MNALLRQASLFLLDLALLRGLHALRGHQLGVANLFEVVLVRAHRRQLLLLAHLHQALLERLAHEDLEEGLDLEVEVEQVPGLNLRGRVQARLGGHEQGRGRAVHERVGLR